MTSVKKILLILFSICLIAVLPLSLISCGGGNTADGITYSGTTVTGADKTATTLSVREGTTVIAAGAFKHCTELSSLSLPSTVNTVHRGAFDGCDSLITEEGGVLYACGWVIGVSDSFGGGSVTLKDGTVGIAEEALAGLDSLTSLTVPDSVRHINSRALFGASGLCEITLPFIGSALDATYSTHIGYIFGAFSHGKNASYVPASLKRVSLTGSARIYDNALSGCTKIESVTLPDTLTEIGKRAFEGCSSLTEIYIPDSVGTIKDRAFINCISLRSARLPINDHFTVIDQYLFAYCSSLEAITVPESVRSIRSCAFGMCESLATLELLNDEPLEQIAQQAFHGCKSLTDLSVKVKSVGKGAFQLCTRLTSADFGRGLTDLGEYALNGCIALKRVSVPEGTERIGDNAFYNCSQLTELSLPTTLSEIGERAFYGCASVGSFKIPGSVERIGTDAFDGCSREVFVTEGGISYIDGWVVDATAALTTAALPATVRGICDGAFDACKNLSRVEYGGSEAEWQALIKNSKNDRLHVVLTEYNTNND